MSASPEGEDSKIDVSLLNSKKIYRFCCWKSLHIPLQMHGLFFLALRAITLELQFALAARLAYHVSSVCCSTRKMLYKYCLLGCCFLCQWSARLCTQEKACPRWWQTKNFKNKMQKLYKISLIPFSFSFRKTFPNSGIMQDKFPDIFKCVSKV